MTDPKDDELFKGPALNADGRLENRFAMVEPPQPPSNAPPPEPELELDVRPPKPPEPRIERFRDEPRTQRKRAMAVVVMLVLLGVGGGIALVGLQPRLEREAPEGVHALPELDRLLQGPGHEPVFITSEPPGATITIDGEVVGQTPWAAENRWVGNPKVVLQLKGFRVWEGKLNGGEAQTLDVQLKK